MNSLSKKNILFEDDSLLVLDKPDNVVVNISDTSPEGTVQNFLAGYLGFTNFKESESEFESRCGIVHRLDKDTSGVLLVAKSEETFYLLQSYFKKRSVKKEYVAVVHEKLRDMKFQINAPIKRDPNNRMRFAVVIDGKDALSNFEKISEKEIEGKWVSSVRVFPETGRTHQIRVHLTALNNPIVGDVLYSGRRQLKWAREVMQINRMLLHAHKLEIPGYPVFESKLPSDFDLFI